MHLSTTVHAFDHVIILLCCAVVCEPINQSKQVRMQAVIAIILSTFAGFSVAICTNSALLQILRWRARHAVASPTTTATAADAQGHGSSSRDRGPPVAMAVAVAEPDIEIALPPAHA